MVGNTIQVGKRILVGYATPGVEMLLFVFIVCCLAVWPWAEIWLRSFGPLVSVIGRMQWEASVVCLHVIITQRHIKNCCVPCQTKHSFQGHAWNKETKREDGSSDFFVHWKSEFDPVLKHHLEHCSKNASYASPAIQNELITLAGDDVKNQILASARAARWFSITVKSD